MVITQNTNLKVAEVLTSKATEEGKKVEQALSEVPDYVLDSYGGRQHLKELSLKDLKGILNLNPEPIKNEDSNAIKAETSDRVRGDEDDKKVPGNVNDRLLSWMFLSGMDVEQMVRDVKELYPRKKGEKRLEKLGWKKLPSENGNTLYELHVDGPYTSWASQAVTFHTNGRTGLDAEVFHPRIRGQYRQEIVMDEKGNVEYNSGVTKVK